MSEELEAFEPPPVDAPAEPEKPIEEVCFPDLPDLGEELEKLDGPNYVKAIRARQAKARLRAAALITLRAQGYSYGEIAQMARLSVNAVKQACKRARAAGKLNDIRNVLENESLALAVDSLNHHLRAKDKQMTIEHLKGMGHWRNYSHSKTEGAPGFTMPALQVNVVIAPGTPQPTAEQFAESEGAIGVPREG